MRPGFFFGFLSLDAARFADLIERFSTDEAVVGIIPWTAS
jgi:hypothetical protein